MASIVVIEDEPILRQLISGELAKRGHQVSAVEDGRLGWELIQRERPDLVLLDLLLPQMSGYDVLTALRQDAGLKKTRCLVFSNSGQADDLNRAYTCGADEVLVKADFDASQVVEKVEQLLARD